MKTALTHSLLCLAMAAPFASRLAAQSAPKPQSNAKASAPGREESNLKISFKIKSQGLESAGSFVVQEGSQVNYVRGGEAPIAVTTGKGTGVEYRKQSTIVNCLAVTDPNRPNRVRAEAQFEISGPLPPPPGLQAPHMATFQIQTTFTAEKGRPTVLVDEPDRSIEIIIEDLP